MNSIIPYAIEVFVLVLAVSLGIGLWKMQRFPRVWGDAARSLGLRYFKEPPAGMMDRWRELLVTVSNEKGSLSHVVEGSYDGRPLLIAWYHYPTSEESCSYSVACFTLARELPYFRLRRESVIDKALMRQDVDFEEDKEFSSRFLVQGDETRLRAVFTPAVRRGLLESGGWSVVGKGHELVVYKESIGLLEPRYLDDFARQTRRVADLFGCCR